MFTSEMELTLEMNMVMRTSTGSPAAPQCYCYAVIADVLSFYYLY